MFYCVVILCIIVLFKLSENVTNWAVSAQVLAETRKFW